MVGIYIRMLPIPFEWFEFAFECVESHSNGSKLLSNGSIPVRMVRILFEWFESCSNGSNLYVNAFNPVQMV